MGGVQVLLIISEHTTNNNQYAPMAFPVAIFLTAIEPTVVKGSISPDTKYSSFEHWEKYKYNLEGRCAECVLQLMRNKWALTEGKLHFTLWHCKLEECCNISFSFSPSTCLHSGKHQTLGGRLLEETFESSVFLLIWYVCYNFWAGLVCYTLDWLSEIDCHPTPTFLFPL